MCYRDFPHSPSPSESGEVLYSPPLFPLFPSSSPEGSHCTPTPPVTSSPMRSPPHYQTTHALWTSLLSCGTELPTQKHTVCLCSLRTGRGCSTPGFNKSTSGKGWTLLPLCFVCKLKKRLNFMQLFHSDYLRSSDKYVRRVLFCIDWLIEGVENSIVPGVSHISNSYAQ